VQTIPEVNKMQLGDRGDLSAQIRDYDTCFAEFLNPSGNGQKILQAILLREAFRLFALQGVAIRQNASTVILDVSCGPGDYSVAWTSQIARRFGAKPDKKIVDRQAARPSSWKTPFIATSIAW
jgi:hypothetical protein